MNAIVPKRRRARASILLYTVVMLVVAGFIVLSIAGAVAHNVHLTKRTEDRLQSFYAAEAGIQHVIHWFNDHLASPFPSYFEPNEDGKFLNEDGSSIITEAYEVPTDWLPQMVGTVPPIDMASVESLRISPPEVDDPPGTVAKATSVGITNTGVRSTVEVHLFTNRIPSILSPAAILARASGAASNGQFKVHWGELWAKGDIPLNNPIDKKFANETEDPWYAARTESWLRDHQGGNYADGSVDGGYSNVPIAEGAPNYFQPFLEETLHTRNNKLRGYENLHQKATDLEWPNYDYHVMKMLAQQRGFPIYRTTPGGQLIVGYDGNGNPITRTFTEVFHTDRDPNTIPYEELPPIYFIDTIDGNPPRADGSNMATIDVQGQGPFFHGYFFIAANFKFGGSGNSPTVFNPMLPDGTNYHQNIQNVRLFGLLYTYGTAQFSGVGDVFGSAFAERGFQGGGTWDVYYDIGLSDEDRNRVGSELAFHLWNTY